jgi:hypothetical protein
MNTIAKSLVNAAIVLALGAVAQGAEASPIDGAVCAAGYTGKLTANRFTCEKNVNLFENFNCAAPFITYRVRANSRDICLRAGVDIDSNEELTDFEQGQRIRFCKPLNVLLNGGRPAGVPQNLLPNQGRAPGVPFNFNGRSCRDFLIGGDYVFVDQNQSAMRSKGEAAARAREAVLYANGANPVEIKVNTVVNDVDGGAGSRDRIKVSGTEFSAPVIR